MTYQRATAGLGAIPYVGAGRMTRRGMARALGDTTQPYELATPGVVTEVKRALIALAMHDSDPYKNPTDPITEETWRKIVTEGPLADTWDGPTADEYVMAQGRYYDQSTDGVPLDRLSGPFMQLGGSRYGRLGIVGGPQPTAHGLELLAGALVDRVGTATTHMPLYMAWRDGRLRPPSEVSGPAATARVIPTAARGPSWQLDGYTPVWPEGDPAFVQAADQVDGALVSCWDQLRSAKTEAVRALVMRDCVLPMRAQHDAAARQANIGAPPLECPAGQKYDPTDGRCKDPGVITIPPTDIPIEVCVQNLMAQGLTEAAAREACGLPPKAWAHSAGMGVVALGAALGLGVYWWQKRSAGRSRR